MIICGYAGIGKSWMGRNCPGVIDLEFTPFEKDWDRYAKCAIHYHKQGYFVLVSCHKEIRERVCHCIDRVQFDDRVTIVPDVSDKDEYKQRYIDRGNTEEFINVQMSNWEKWLDEKSNRILGENWIVMKKGETLFECIMRLSKEEPYVFCNYNQCPVGDCKMMGDRCLNPLSMFVDKWRNECWFCK